MSKFLFSGKRSIFRIRLCSFLLAVLICPLTVSIIIFAADIPNASVYIISDTGAQESAISANSNESTAGTAADSSSSADTADQTSDEEALSSQSLQVNISAQSALIVGTGRGMKLYQKNQEIPANYPAASKLMTAVIALEALTLDTQVTISSEAEALDEEATNPLSLSKGEKCSVKYLVSALIYMDSDAAALSLAEYIASDEESFVNRMNETAKALNMSSTFFVNTSGKAVLSASSYVTNSSPYSAYALQYTTLSDLSSLFRYALGLTEFRDLFTKHKTLMFLSDGTPQTLTSSMSAAWGLNPQLKGAARFESDEFNASSCILAFAAVEDFEIAIVLGGSKEDSTFLDLYTSINTIFSAYEVSDLVVAGDAYRQVTLEGIPEPLAAVFKNTARYIHPVGEDYILPNATFIPAESVALPVSIGQSLGQVMFELEDGTLIETEVVAAQSMWTKSTLLSETIALLVANRNLTVIIGIAVAVFLLTFLWSALCFINKIVRRQARRISSKKH